MNEYIDRQKLIERIQRDIVCLSKDGEECKQVILKYIKSKIHNPVADVAEVVRCKDCVYNKNVGCMHSEDYDEDNYNPDYFCADGERVKDAGEVEGGDA